MALLPASVVIVIVAVLALLATGLLWLYGKKRSSRRPWAWFLLLLCCMGGWMNMTGYRQEGTEKDVLRLAGGKRVWVGGNIVGIGEKEKSYGLTLAGCRVMTGLRGNTGHGDGEYEGGNVDSDVAEYEIPDLVVYVEKEKFERVEKQQAVRLGMEVAVFGKLEEPSEARNPGEFDFREYYRALGIRLQMFGEDMEILDDGSWRYRDFLYRMRKAAARVLEEICEPEDLGIFQAAILGDKASLDDGVRRLYQRNGIAHLLAISGLHISLLGMFVYRMLRKAGMSYGVSGVIGTVVIVSYGMLTGGSSSVIRAVMMILVFLLAGYLGRSYDMLSAAGLACILILLEYPGMVTQAGFQLSFGAVAAIGGLGPWMVEKLGVKHGFGKTVVLGAAVQMVTGPVIVYHFYQYPVYGIVLNLVVIPLMGYVVVSGILGILLGAMWQPAGIVAVGSGHYILKGYRWLCIMFEKLPGANLVIGRPGLWQIGAYGVTMALLLWFVCGRRAVDDAGRPYRLSPLCTRLVILTAGTAACFLLMWQLPVRGMEVTFLDVGQGDGICIRTKEAVILVDGGSTDKKELGKNTLEPYLKSLGICQVDYAVISHGDKDHISGIQYLLEENGDIRIRNLVLPWLGRKDSSYEPLVRLMEAHGGQVHWMQAGERIKAGALSLTCLYHGSEVRRQDRNEHSLVLELHYGQTGILLTGDMSENGEKDMIAGNCLNLPGNENSGENCPPGESRTPGGVCLSGEHHIQILKAAHHGSRYSSCEAFLRLISPEWTVISCGEGNSYGHPHKEMLERLEDQGTEILVTEDEGAIVVSTDGEQIRFDSYLEKDSRRAETTRSVAGD